MSHKDHDMTANGRREMGEVQRYDRVLCGQYDTYEVMEECDTGEWVRYDDHAAEVARLTRERDEAVARAELAEAVCREIEYGEENHPDDSKLGPVYREWKAKAPPEVRLEGYGHPPTGGATGGGDE